MITQDAPSLDWKHPDKAKASRSNHYEPTAIVWRGPMPIGGFRFPAPTAAYRGPAPSAAYRGPAPSAAYRGPAPIAGWRGPAPSCGTRRRSRQPIAGIRRY